MGTEHTESLWQAFANQESLNQEQIIQFKTYYEQLVQWNEIVNLTRITYLNEVIAYHFQDSLSFSYTVPCNDIITIADIGSGAGFPSIPLKIKYPHLKIIIIEVSGKRIAFLEHLIKELNLNNVILYQQDWRTFLRHSTEHIDYFCARASLSIPELLRAFKPTSTYRNSQLVYWASDQWQPLEAEKAFVQKIIPYIVGNKHRKLVFFAAP